MPARKKVPAKTGTTTSSNMYVLIDQEGDCEPFAVCTSLDEVETVAIEYFNKLFKDDPHLDPTDNTIEIDVYEMAPNMVLGYDDRIKVKTAKPKVTRITAVEFN